MKNGSVRFSGFFVGRAKRKVREALEHFHQRRLRFDPRQRRADADVRTAAESDMRPWFAGHRMRQGFRRPPDRDWPERSNEITDCRLSPAAADFHVMRRHARRDIYRPIETKNFFHDLATISGSAFSFASSSRMGEQRMTPLPPRSLVVRLPPTRRPMRFEMISRSFKCAFGPAMSRHR